MGWKFCFTGVGAARQAWIVGKLRVGHNRLVTEGREQWIFKLDFSKCISDPVPRGEGAVLPSLGNPFPKEIQRGASGFLGQCMHERPCWIVVQLGKRAHSYCGRGYWGRGRVPLPEPPVPRKPPTIWKNPAPVLEQPKRCCNEQQPSSGPAPTLTASGAAEDLQSLMERA